MFNTQPSQNRLKRNVCQGNTNLAQSVTEIIRRESLHEFAAEGLLFWQTPKGQAIGYNTDDQYLLEIMRELTRLYARIMDGDVPLIVPTFVRWAKRPGFKLTQLGKDVLYVCRRFASLEEERRNWQQAYAHHQFHPIVTVMLRAVMRWWQPICLWGEPSHALVEGEQPEAVEKMLRLANFVRRVSRSQMFNNLLHDHDRKAEDNFRSGCDYLIAEFELHSRLLILRIDLYFRPDAKGWGYSKQADKAVFNYLRSLRRGRIVPGYIGSLIKRENGISRGMHYHLMVLIDGHQHRSSWFITQCMGEAWLRRVGNDKGSFFNCYAMKDQYLYNGLGLVHVSDIEKLIGLRIAIWYMSKQNSILKVDDAKVKNFWRSLMPGEPDGRGAPRKSGDRMSLVKRLLGGKRSKYPLGFEPLQRKR